MPARRSAGRLVLVCALACPALGCGSSDSDAKDAAVDAAISVEPLTENDYLEACVRLHACGVQKHPRLGDCVANYRDVLLQAAQRQLYDQAYRCVNAGQGDCKIIRECLGFPGKPVKSCDATYTPRCEGEVAYNCDTLAKWEQSLDCSKGGLKCAVKQAGTTAAAVCGGGECDPAAMKADCREWKRWQCVGGAIEIQDCLESNLQCRDSTTALCEGRGRSCREFAPECKGNTVVKCTNGYISEYDCGKTRACDAANAKCVPGGKECATDGFFDACEGNNLVVCIDGFKRTFDCTALGFLGCEEGKPGDACKAAPVY